ncbi:hypothetical protein [Shewanella algae]|uniref:hypothetical protein n=1 Tax=Shewanella algae TaxID=38313 RepID=UPI000D14D9B7|nr:hypothetical protein [Shewanella algae]PST67106.1 hypothetical protein AYI77_10160 [Shewanella algae]
MFVIAILIIVSIFFPPAWFALVAYIVYLIVTKKKRRDRVIIFEIQKLIATGQEEVILKHLYYEAAKSFAAERGASMSSYRNDPADDCLIFDMDVNGKEYSICVQRWLKDETMLTVKTKSKSREELLDSIGNDSFLFEMLNNGLNAGEYFKKENLEQDEILAKLSKLSESDKVKTCRMLIQSIDGDLCREFEFSDEELEMANELLSVLYELRNGDFVAPVLNITN